MDIYSKIHPIPISKNFTSFKLKDMDGKFQGFSKRDGRNKACHGWKILQKS